MTENASGLALRILCTHGIEIRSMRIDSPAAHRGVTLEAITLAVACGATLQTLPGRHPVAEEPKRTRIVERRPGPAGRGQPDLRMAASAKHLGVMTGRAFYFVSVRVRRMTLQEIPQVETR